MFSRSRLAMPDPSMAPAGRSQPILKAGAENYISGRPLKPPYPEGTEVVDFALGCFWGAERLFWRLGPGVWTTAVGYAGGVTPNPTYDEVCTGRTGHTEIVRVVYDPSLLPFESLLKAFWEAHDPTQGYRQGNDVGTQYRSAIFASDNAQLVAAEASRERYQAVLTEREFPAITTDIRAAPPFYFAEEHHQQYLAKVPHGYCGLSGTGVACPIPGAGPAAE